MFVQECHICQQNKAKHTHPTRLLQPLPIPEQKWESISMDFITGLPHVQGKDCIYVVVDRLTKFAHFFAISSKYSAAQVAESFFREVFRLHGLPKTIVSDRDSRFMGDFWQELFGLVGTELMPSRDKVEHSFEVRDLVYLCLQPYRQSSLKMKGAEKLKPGFYGPYRISRQVREVAYELDLPKGCKIYNVFHVSCLKKAVGQHVVTSTELPPLDEEGQLILIPEEVLDTRERKLRNMSIKEYLIKWENLPIEDATWEGE
jgi:hypothetical protein